MELYFRRFTYKELPQENEKRLKLGVKKSHAGGHTALCLKALLLTAICQGHLAVEEGISDLISDHGR